MCGILSVISSRNSKYTSDLEVFNRALAQSKHRGPDDSRINKINESCLFGFNRLGIQDLSAHSMQPFFYKGNWIVFNGEIYNYRELRDELISNGAVFSTTGDTEILVEGLTLYGPEFVKKLNGIFAFVFYNSHRQTYLVARDRLGVKPLFYTQNEEVLIFSSEIKSILEYVPARLNIETLHRHMFLDWFIGYKKDETFFENVHMLGNGTYHVYSASGKLLGKETYYQPDFSNSVTDFRKIENEFPRLVNEAFSLETRSDAKVGMAFSGGIDTSTILTLATPHLVKQQDTIPIYTFYYEQKGENTDLLYARKTVDFLSKQYGNVFDVHEYNMDANLTQQDFEDAILARETPIFDIRYITMTKLYREVRKTGIKVALSGQGSDEVFYGYYPLDYWLSRFYREGVLNAENVLGYFEKTLNVEKNKILNKEFLTRARESAWKHLTEIFSRIENVDPQQKKLTALIRETMLQAFMLYEDKFGMSAGLEVRVPMINQLLVEYIDKCDYKVNLISSNAGRHLFRLILKDKLPEEIISRGKVPTAKKKKYTQELLPIYLEHKDSLLQSELLNSIYEREFLEDPFNTTNDSGSFYGNKDDVLLELLGLYFFEKKMLNNFTAL